MANQSLTVANRAPAESPYQLSTDQVLRASNALLKHIKTEEKNKEEGSSKKKLPLGDDDVDSDCSEEAHGDDGIPVWLVLTTKKHIVDKARLKPGKIAVPHSLNSSTSLNICLITADPQRAAKDAIHHPSFPQALSSRITRIIGFSKLKERYKSFESRRQLLSEHDVFLADDRIIIRLVQVLGKTFFKSAKRPIPVRIEEIQKVDGKRLKKDEKKRPPPDQAKYAAVAAPNIVAREIERTLASVPVNLAPAATAAVRVGWSRFSAEQLKDNIEAVMGGMVEKFVSRGWRNIKAVHIKGANTTALPIWLADELWLEERDVLEIGEKDAIKAVDDKKKNGGKKRRSAIADDGAKLENGSIAKKAKLTHKEKAKVGGAKDDAEIAIARKAKIQAQKAKGTINAEASEQSTATAPKDDTLSGPSKKKKKSTIKK